MENRKLTIAAVLAVTLLAGCKENIPENRGIGIYPGNPEQDFSPVISAFEGRSENLAFRRAAYASSSFDYNLTAHLVTDGIKCDVMPATMELSTPQGAVAAVDREFMFDFKPNSGSTFNGRETFVRVDWNGYRPKFDKVQVKGRVNRRNGRWQLLLQSSTDGEVWHTAGRADGNGQIIDASFESPANDMSSHIRIVMKADAETSWNISDWDFLNGTEPVPVIPSYEFHSAWMSSTGGHEWIYVDLGAESDVDAITLDWINPARTGSIMYSDDAVSWKKAANLSESSQYSFDRPVSTRYIKLELDESIDGKSYVLSEMKVSGTGGVAVHPHPAPPVKDGRLTLSGGNWKLQRENETAGSPQAISVNGYDDSGWLTATVPGTVLSSFVNAGAVPEPNYSDNQLQISESFFYSDFWYRNQFFVPENMVNDRLFLDFDGINWKAHVWVNGKETGKIDGAFTRARFDVTDLVIPGQENTVAVLIMKNEHLGSIKEQTAITAQGNGGILGADNPTFHASIGWDWIPTIRGRNIGIWNDVSLTATGAVTLSDPQVLTRLELPDTTHAQIDLGVDLQNWLDRPVEGLLKGSYGNIRFNQTVSLAAGERKHVRIAPIDMKNPHLWWPKGYGEPYLYNVEMTFSIDGKESDRTSFKSGIRQMSYNTDGGVLKLYVNGRRFVGRGGNWGFSESNLNYREREYDAAVRYHADMNFTMIRNWVGQTGDDEFFEACDRWGVMVWQDFWLANPVDGPDPYNNDMFMDNARDFVLRIRNHPSIALYVGRNEGNPPADIDNGLHNLTREIGNGIHYISNSASGVVSGGGPYNALQPRAYFSLYGQDRFHSERGMPDVMNYESLTRAIPENKLWPQNSLWGLHDFTMESAQRGSTFNSLVEQAAGKVTDVRDFTRWAQLINYNGYRAIFESRSNGRHGMLLWMSHPAWPSMVWQTYDWYLEPNGGYFGSKKGCEPLHIQWNQGKDYIEVVNISSGHHRELKAEARLLNTDGTVIWEKAKVIESDEDSSVKCFDMEYPDNLTDTHFISLTLTENGKTVSENFYVRGCKEGDYKGILSMPKAEISQKMSVSTSGSERIVKLKLKNMSSVPAVLVRVNLTGADGGQILPVIYSDNYFSMLPFQEKTVTIRYNVADARRQNPQVTVSALN